MTLRACLLLGAAALLQLTLAGRIDPSLPEPNLVLALVLGRALVAGGGSGMRWGLAGGLLLDLGATGPLGLHALAMLAAAYAAGVCATAFDSRRLPAAALAGAAGAGVYALVVLGAADSLGLAQVSLRTALPVAAAESALAGLIAVPIVQVMLRAGRAPEPAWR